MAVVINELEVTSTPPPKPNGGAAQPSAQQGPPALMPDMAREIEKTFHRKQERIHRLTAC
jgi:hypothetical protein